MGIGRHKAGAEEQGVELRAEGAAEVREARCGLERDEGVDASEEGGGVRAGREAKGGEEKSGEEARMAVAAAGDEERVGLEELARGGEPWEQVQHAVERPGHRTRRRHAAGGARALAAGEWVGGASAFVARDYAAWVDLSVIGPSKP